VQLDGVWYDDNSCDDNEFLAKASRHLRLLHDSDGVPVGRACIGLGDRRRSGVSTAPLRGTVTVGGLAACDLRGIAGVLSGTSERAARDYATPIVSGEILAAWATEQALLVPSLYDSPEDQMDCATVIKRCGGQTAGLPVAKYERAYVSMEEISAMALPNEYACFTIRS